MASSGPDTQLLATLANTPVDEPISPNLLASALSSPPFVALPGSLNARDIGAFAPGYVKPRTVFRSGALDFIPEAARARLRSELGLSRIYDFRRGDEVKAPLCRVDGIEVLRCPYMDGAERPPAVVVSGFAPTGRGYQDMYDVILKGYTTGYRKVFEALRTASEDDAVLFHCTAGKDRTGVMAALILDLMGAPAQLIGDEYALTRIGTEPFVEELLPAAVESFGDIAAPEGSADKAGFLRGKLAVGSPGMRELLSTSAAVMVDFVGHLRREYGGAEGYMKTHLGFSDDQVEEVRDNLRPSLSI